MSQNMRAVGWAWSRHGRIWNVDASGWATMSASYLRANPSMAEPSKPTPSAKAPSTSAGEMATDLRNPRTSVNHSRTNRTSRSSIERKTNSVCLSMAHILPCLCFGCVTPLYPAFVRLVTSEGDLARKGFAEPARAVRQIEALGEHAGDDVAFLVDEMSHTLEPDLALATLVELVGNDPSLVRSLVGNN